MSDIDIHGHSHRPPRWLHIPFHALSLSTCDCLLVLCSYILLSCCLHLTLISSPSSYHRCCYLSLPTFRPSIAYVHLRNGLPFVFCLCRLQSTTSIYTTYIYHAVFLTDTQISACCWKIDVVPDIDVVALVIRSSTHSYSVSIQVQPELNITALVLDLTKKPKRSRPPNKRSPLTPTNLARRTNDVILYLRSQTFDPPRGMPFRNP